MPNMRRENIIMLSHLTISMSVMEVKKAVDASKWLLCSTLIPAGHVTAAQAVGKRTATGEHALSTRIPCMRIHCIPHMHVGEVLPTPSIANTAEKTEG